MPLHAPFQNGSLAQPLPFCIRAAALLYSSTPYTFFLFHLLHFLTILCISDYVRVTVHIYCPVHAVPLLPYQLCEYSFNSILLWYPLVLYSYPVLTVRHCHLCMQQNIVYKGLKAHCCNVVYQKCWKDLKVKRLIIMTHIHSWKERTLWVLH